MMIEWASVRNLLPPQTGKYNIQIVLDTPKGKWITPLMTVEVALPDTDQASSKRVAATSSHAMSRCEPGPRAACVNHLIPS